LEKDIIKLVIKDTGSGMSDDVQAQIFQPFFTTKPAYDDDLDDPKTPCGYGIELYLTEMLFQKYNIKVEISSAPAQGSVFELKIPPEKINA
jgi:signal transduction histidine kinase